jgi:hypothetical protein
MLVIIFVRLPGLDAPGQMLRRVVEGGTGRIQNFSPRPQLAAFITVPGSPRFWGNHLLLVTTCLLWTG